MLMKPRRITPSELAACHAYFHELGHPVLPPL
jgi:hypothetical protein